MLDEGVSVDREVRDQDCAGEEVMLNVHDMKDDTGQIVDDKDWSEQDVEDEEHQETGWSELSPHCELRRESSVWEGARHGEYGSFRFQMSHQKMPGRGYVPLHYWNLKTLTYITNA